MESGGLPWPEVSFLFLAWLSTCLSLVRLETRTRTRTRPDLSLPSPFLLPSLLSHPSFHPTPSLPSLSSLHLPTFSSNQSYPPPESFPSTKDRKRILLAGAVRFNTKPKLGLAFLESNGLLTNVPGPERSKAIASLLKSTPKLDKTMLGDYLGRPENVEVLRAFIGLFDFKDVSFRWAGDGVRGGRDEAEGRRNGSGGDGEADLVRSFHRNSSPTRCETCSRLSDFQESLNRSRELQRPSLRSTSLRDLVRLNFSLVLALFRRVELTSVSSLFARSRDSIRRRRLRSRLLHHHAQHGSVLSSSEEEDDLRGLQEEPEGCELECRFLGYFPCESRSFSSFLFPPFSLSRAESFRIVRYRWISTNRSRRGRSSFLLSIKDSLGLITLGRSCLRELLLLVRFSLSLSLPPRASFSTDLVHRLALLGPMLVCDSPLFDRDMFNVVSKQVISSIAYASVSFPLFLLLPRTFAEPLLSFVLHSFTTFNDDYVIQRAITGFRQCATLAGKFHLPEVFDHIVMALSQSEFFMFPSFLLRVRQLTSVFDLTATGLLDDRDPSQSSLNNPVVEVEGQSLTVSGLSVRFGLNFKAQLAAVVLFTIANGNGNSIREGWSQVSLRPTSSSESKRTLTFLFSLSREHRSSRCTKPSSSTLFSQLPCSRWRTS